METEFKHKEHKEEPQRKQKIRDFVEYWGKSFDVDTIREYVDISDKTIRKCISELIDEGVVVKVSRGLYKKRLKSLQQVKHEQKMQRKIHVEKLKTKEQTSILRDYIKKQIMMMKGILKSLDDFEREMDEFIGRQV